MALQTSFTCDVCGKAKGESNHWFTFINRDATIHIEPFGNRDVHSSVMEDICGSSCLTKRVNQIIDKWRKS